MAMQQVSGPMGAAFGTNPFEFIMNVVGHAHSELRKLTRRMVLRTGDSKWTSHPVMVQGRRISMVIPLESKSGDTRLQTALKLAAWASYRPTVLVDEARRQAYGLNIGPKSADAGDQILDLPATWGQAQSVEPVTTTVGLGGISLAAILTMAVPIIVAIAPIVLPLLISAVGGASDAVKDVVKGVTDKPAPPPPPPDDKVLGIPLLAWVAGAVVIAGVIIVRF